MEEIKMNKKLLELLNSINEKKTEVKALVEAGKLDEAKEAKNSLKEMQDKFDILKDMDDVEPATNSAQPVKVVSTEKSFAQNVRELPLNLMKEGVDENGGYIVPADVQTKINHYKESHKSVRDIVTVENVTTNKAVSSCFFMEPPNGAALTQTEKYANIHTNVRLTHTVSWIQY